MARVATKTDVAPAKRTATRFPDAGKKQVAKSTGGSDLSSLVLSNKEMEDAERAKTGSQSSFITLVKANSGIIDKNNPNYIKGVKPLDYAISSKKLALGKELDATIIGMFKLYAEVAAKEKESDMPKTVKFWHPDDAMQYPVEGYFDRPLPNGNILQPRHWVFLYLHKHPEITDGLIAFGGKGNKIYVELEKLIKAESKVCTELRFKVTNQDIYNDGYKKTDYYPKFEITGHNYKLTEDGKVVKAKDSDVDEETLREILTRSNKVQKAYREMRMVARQSVHALPAPAGRKAIGTRQEAYEEDEDDAVSF